MITLLMSSMRGLWLEMELGMDWVKWKEKSVVRFSGRIFSVLRGVVGGKRVWVISWSAVSCLTTQGIRG